VSGDLTPLSDREMEIVRLLATGATNHEIARELFISVNTVKVHLRNIYTKLEVNSRTEATMVAVREGWVEVPRTDDEVEQEAPSNLPSRALPRLPKPVRVSPAKQVALLVATLLAVGILFLPQVLQSGNNGEVEDPIGSVFPTTISGVATSRWNTRAQMPTPRTDLAVVVYDGQIYAIGGVGNDGVVAKVEVYDPQAEAWTSRRSKPTPVGFVSAVAVGDRIYVPGGIGAGVQPQDVLEVYDPVADRWESRASMPEPLGAYGLAVYDEQIYLFGGRDRQGYVASVYRYDPQADRWETLEPMDRPRGHVGAAALGERIYVVGGYDGMTEFKTCEAYEPAAGAWTPCSPMALRRGGLALLAVREKLYAIGGGRTGYLAFNESYDPRIDVWTRFETPVTRQWQGLGAGFVFPYIYAIGGWNGDYLSANEAYQALFQVIITP
jgi:DNA-binding CsgD family transcriptional regulator